MGSLGPKFRVSSGFYKASRRYILTFYKAPITVTTHLKMSFLIWGFPQIGDPNIAP